MKICENCVHKKIGIQDDSFTHEFGIERVETEVEYCELTFFRLDETECLRSMNR